MNDPTNQQHLNTAQLKPSMQTMVALLFFIGTIVSLLMYRYGTTHDFFNYDDIDLNDWEEKSKAMNIALYTFWRNCELFHFLIPLIGYSLLYKLASNKSARLFVVLPVIGNGGRLDSGIDHLCLCVIVGGDHIVVWDHGVLVPLDNDIALITCGVFCHGVHDDVGDGLDGLVRERGSRVHDEGKGEHEDCGKHESRMGPGAIEVHVRIPFRAVAWSKA